MLDGWVWVKWGWAHGGTGEKQNEVRGHSARENRQSNDQHGQLKQSAHSAQAKTKRHNIYRRNSAKRLESCAAERMTEGSAHWPWSSPYSWCQRRRLPCQTTRATPARRWPRPPARSTARSTTPRRCAPTSGSSYSSRKTWRSVARLVRQRVHQRQQLGVQIRIAQRFEQRFEQRGDAVRRPTCSEGRRQRCRKSRT